MSEKENISVLWKHGYWGYTTSDRSRGLIADLIIVRYKGLKSPTVYDVEVSMSDDEEMEYDIECICVERGYDEMCVTFRGEIEGWA